MGTHPIFESDFDCLTEMANIIESAWLNRAHYEGAMDRFQVFKATGKTFQALAEENLDMERVEKLESENADLKKKLADVLARLSKIEGQLASGATSAPAAAAPAEEDDSDVDLFASDDEVDEEAERIKAERVAAYEARKAAKEDKKGKVIAKSNIILDIKPWDDETDMKALEDSVRSVAMDGLLWGTGKLVAVGYGIKKLQITCVVEDDKVGTDALEDQITAFDDYVQSVDIVAFNKI